MTLDLGLQQEGEKALLEGIEHARAGGKPATAGAFVAMDPLNGEILAIGSYPTLRPEQVRQTADRSRIRGARGQGRLRRGEEAPAPLTDRAVNGAYPTGSTFKPITAMAALEAGVINPTEGLGAGQCISVSTEQFCNAGKADYGAVGLVEALKVSSDTYFFEVGELANSHGNVIQNMAHELGIGEHDRDRPAERDRRHRPRSRRGARNRTRCRNKCEHEQHHGHRCGYRRRSAGRGASATTCTWRSARAIC